MKVAYSLLLTSSLFFHKIIALPVMPGRDANFHSFRTRLDRPHGDLQTEPLDKYFHESTFHQHYDGRFASKPLQYREKQAYISALIQTYLIAMNNIGAETWLMHGTLLGWYWNREAMPWDSDLDVMVSQSSINLLANYHNMTEHRFKLPGQRTTRKYLLEINPHYRENAIDKHNQIDARWIDTEVGLFIDITTLRWNSTADSRGYSESMVVKDNHHYLYDDIFPLRKSLFQGNPAKVPYAYTDILAEEYGDDALSKTAFAHHRFDAKKEQWVPTQVSIPGN